MEIDEDEILAGALGSLGRRVAGPSARGGVEWVARRLRKDVLELKMAARLPPTAVADHVRQVLSQQGRLIADEDHGGSEVRRIVGIVGAGFANLNPAVVTIDIRPSEEGTRVAIRGAAKEGLLKQRAGEEAARRVAAAIETMSANQP